MDSNPWCYILLFGYKSFHPWTLMRCPLNICQLNPKWCSFMDLNFDTLVGKIYIIPYSFKIYINHHNWSLSTTIGNSSHWSHFAWFSAQICWWTYYNNLAKKSSWECLTWLVLFFVYVHWFAWLWSLIS